MTMTKSKILANLFDLKMKELDLYYEYKSKIAELDEEVAAYEKKVEAEEDARDKEEKIRKEKENERKKKNSQKEKELDESFFEEWADKFKALKNIIPSTENNFTGKGREKKFKAEFRRKGNLLLTILKTLN